MRGEKTKFTKSYQGQVILEMHHHPCAEAVRHLEKEIVIIILNCLNLFDGLRSYIVETSVPDGSPKLSNVEPG